MIYDITFNATVHLNESHTKTIDGFNVSFIGGTEKTNHQ